jgi:hypothetical protein
VVTTHWAGSSQVAFTKYAFMVLALLLPELDPPNGVSNAATW